MELHYNSIMEILQINHLEKIRATKSRNKQATIKQAFIKLIQAKETPTRHKKTNITDIAINKYYDEVVK